MSDEGAVVLGGNLQVEVDHRHRVSVPCEVLDDFTDSQFHTVNGLHSATHNHRHGEGARLLWKQMYMCVVYRATDRQRVINWNLECVHLCTLVHACIYDYRNVYKYVCVHVCMYMYMCML